MKQEPVLQRRQFLAGAACAVPLAFSAGRAGATDAQAAEAVDFSRSFCHYESDEGRLWVRVNLECRCEVFNRSTGASEEYLLSVRTQTGLRTDPLSDVADPGYDFWFIFSKRHVYRRRTLASSYGDSSSRVPTESFESSPGWHVHRAPATPLTSGAELRDALRSWHSVVARSELLAADGVHGYRLEYPVKWADGNPDGSFRVETGPVVLLDPERIRVGTSPTLDDFQWAYLDYRSKESTKVFLERPTPVLSGTVWEDGFRKNPKLTSEQRRAIEDRLFKGWKPPIPMESLRTVFERNHYSTAERRKMKTELFSLG